MTTDRFAQDLLTRLPGLAERRRAGDLAPAVFASLYFFLWQMALHERQFASRRRRDHARPDMTAWLTEMEINEGEALRARLLDWLGRYQFRGVIANVPVALVQWLRGAWPLELREDVPGPREMLRMQARGTRAVTALSAWPRMREPVLNKPDAFAFFLHDLEHAYKFFHSPALHAGQRVFFTALEDAVERGVFAPYSGDAGFTDKFHYLMSDMNTHPEHGRQYLRAILIEFYLRREGRAPAAPLSAASERAIDGVMHAVGRVPLAVTA